MGELHVPGVSVAVIHAGKIEWARGFGVTKLGGPPVTPDTLFQAASISKPLTAMAALHVVQSGKINLDVDVNGYLRTWKVPTNGYTEHSGVTLRELLTHTAGLTVSGFDGYPAGAPVPTLLQVLTGERPANSAAIRVDTIPGTVWRYSGGGYVVVQQLLMDLTGQSFPALMRDMVLRPIGMTNSVFAQPLPPDRLDKAALPYQRNGQPVPGGPHVYPELAPAGLWTTASDLARYVIEVQKSLAGTSNKVLSAALTRQMLTPGLHRQGLGPEIGGSEEHPYFTHGGANEGYQSNLVAYYNGEGVVVMTNGDAGALLAAQIVSSVAAEYGWADFRPIEHSAIKVDGHTLEAYAGTWRTPYATFTITHEGDQLFLQAQGEPRVEMFAEGERNFFVKVADVQFSFELDSQGKASKFMLRQGGFEQTAVRLGGPN